ncbi:hypothetical protein, partial [Reyranella sp.]|uniref:hypothetical protein n=1 Tax=Reyranella sp. TaxID=1929291 RepID=UPI0025D442A8
MARNGKLPNECTNKNRTKTADKNVTKDILSNNLSQGVSALFLKGKLAFDTANSGSNTSGGPSLGHPSQAACRRRLNS